MQLDKTHVAIRLRTLSEIGDLSLVMLRKYPSAIFVGFTLGALPWALANLLLVGWIPIEQSMYGINDTEAQLELYRYLSWMALLVIAQTPAAGIATTYYLGQAVFEHRPPWKNVFKEVRRTFWRWFWVLCVKRMAIVAMVLVAVRISQPAHAFWDVLIPIFLFVYLALVRNSRPFAPEILVLEQCPLKAKLGNAITYSRRSQSLHGPMSGELSGRFMAVGTILFFIFLSVLYTVTWARGIVTNEWSWDLLAYLLLYPLALWIIAGVSVIVRLLCYLDARIRLEGWEVELAIRAEAIRQFGQEQPLVLQRQNTPPAKPTAAPTPPVAPATPATSPNVGAT